MPPGILGIVNRIDEMTFRKREKVLKNVFVFPTTIKILLILTNLTFSNTEYVDDSTSL